MTIPNVYELNDEESFYLFTLMNNKIPGFGKINFCGYEGVTYGGEQYVAIPVQISGLTYSSNGAEITATLSVGDAKGAIGRLVATYGGIEGAEVAVQRVKRRILDNGETPIFQYRQPPEVFKIIGKTSERPEQFSYKLKNRSALKGQIPSRILNDTCSWKRYKGSGCFYDGRYGMFTVDNIPTIYPELDVCALTKKACQLRANYENFSGVATINSF